LSIEGDGGKLSYITVAVMNGYHINNGDITTMTPLQKMAMVTINQIIFKWKSKNKPLVTL